MLDGFKFILRDVSGLLSALVTSDLLPLLVGAVHTERIHTRAFVAMTAVAALPDPVQPLTVPMNEEEMYCSDQHAHQSVSQYMASRQPAQARTRALRR